MIARAQRTSNWRNRLGKIVCSNIRLCPSKTEEAFANDKVSFAHSPPPIQILESFREMQNEGETRELNYYSAKYLFYF